MPSTIGEVDKLFAAGAESVTLTRAEWEAMQEISKGYHANGTEVSSAKREVERITRISKPVWRACKVVAAQMRQEMSLRTGRAKCQRGESSTGRCAYVTRWTSVGRTFPRLTRSGWSIGGGGLRGCAVAPTTLP